jgi:tetratricopeptide (TPR) repeat protein
MLAHVDALIRRSAEFFGQASVWDHAVVRDAATAFARLYTHAARFYPSERLLRRALEASDRILGPNHAYSLSTALRLGYLYWTQGCETKAWELNWRVYRAYESSFGADHPEILRLMHNLAQGYLSRGEVARAEEMLKQAFESCRKALRPDD